VSRTRRARRPPKRAGPRPLDGTRALTCDLWYTLVYLRSRERAVLERARRRIWVRALADGGLPRRDAAAGADALESWCLGEEAGGRTPSLSEQAVWLADRTGVSVSADAVGHALDAALLRRDVRVAPGAREAIAALRDGGIHLAIVSNVRHETGPGTRRLLERLGLLAPFETVYLSCEHRWAKPRPEPFEVALSEVGVPPSAACHVGNLTGDIVGARSAGVQPLLYTGLREWEGAGWPPHCPIDVLRVDRWSEIPEWLVDGRRPAGSEGKAG
jgi:FMN phosphatase YigB (HAD superfamily)